jgi:hypothetical protein
MSSIFLAYLTTGYGNNGLCVASARTGLQLKTAQYAGSDGVRIKPGDLPVCENLLKEI